MTLWVVGFLALAWPPSSAAEDPATGSGAAPSIVTGENLIAFTDVNIVPMDSDRVLAHQTVVIRGDRIEAVGPVASTAVPPEAKRIDGHGLWLMPGLVDMHVHLNDPDDGAVYVAKGVTTIRNMWGFPEHLAWRKEYMAGTRLGPTVYSTGPLLDGRPPIWPMSTIIETPAQADSEVAAEKQAGYDYVKVYSRLSRRAYEAIGDAARRYGMRVVGHVPDSVGVLDVLAEHKQASIEHLTGYMEAAQKEGSPALAMTNRDEQRRALLANLDEAKIPVLAQQTRDAGVWSCVTLIVRDRMAALGQRDSLMKLPGVKYVAPEMVAAWAPTKDFRFKTTTAADFAAMQEVLRFQMRMTRALRDAGARILMGTDTSNPFVVPGFSAHEELVLLVAAGLTPYEALRAGTASAAEFLQADIGVVAQGKRADLILAERNPLKDVRAAAQPKGVVLRGRWMPASELAGVLEKIAKLRASQPATAQ